MGCLPEFKNYKPHVSFYMRSGKYSIKIADTPDEIRAALRLRYRVFYRNIRPILMPLALDVTPYDHDADHLIVRSDAGDIVGTYRLRSSKFTDDYFSKSEFFIQDLLMKENGKTFLELGRACIDPSHRQGAVIICLWRGIFTYIMSVKANFVFGCTSVYTSDAEMAASVQTYLQQNHFTSTDYNITPKQTFANYDAYRGASKDVSKLVPPLLETYLKMGTKVYGDPSFDAHFQCTDFFSILKTANLDPAYAKKLS